MKIDEIIKIENLTVSFGDFTALNNISCSINENSGVVGLNKCYSRTSENFKWDCLL